MTIRFSISLSVLKIFAAELQSRPKSGQILHVFRPPNFFGVCPSKFWTGIIKLGLVLTTVQNFMPVGPRISEISCWEKNLKKTSGLKHKSAPQAIAFGRTNYNHYPISEQQHAATIIHIRNLNVSTTMISPPNCPVLKVNSEIHTCCLC